MKLRNHHKMKWQNHANWPPTQWTGSGTKMLVSTPEIEQSIFKKASLIKT
jgi:hypothetical protein